jgi:arabinan endo-1,5-alpha-L-arabinosidase
MGKLFTLILALVPFVGTMAQEVEVTSAQAKTMYKNTTKNRVSVHDPSIVWEPNSQRYYIFGTHTGTAYTKNLKDWTGVTLTWKSGSVATEFVTPAVKKVMKGGVEVDFPQFNAMEWSQRDASTILGNLWAPDIIWNPTMQKWCQYLSVNGDNWYSSIVLLTSSNIEGPYEYQGPVVISGFYNSSHSYKKTDLEIVLGTQASLPSRYSVGSGWGNRYPNNIDPCVFYDEEGKLWLVYGSWSGGIWMLQLDEATGLRDYDITYTQVGSGDGITTDPYFGKKVAGGYYVSGEAPYIEHVGNYYYLFVSYGNFTAGGLDAKNKPVGGYQMRLFRSEKPDGPYKDANGTSAIYNSYVLNYGNGSDTRGVKVMGPYDHWGFMSEKANAKEGELSQGHNSIIAAEDGRTYLVYHTRFNVGMVYDAIEQKDVVYEGHSVRVHQMFLTENGWLVASPFEYNGETLTDQDMATTENVAASDIPGEYQLLVHRYKNDIANFETVEPVTITLTADNMVTGAYTGTWSTTQGTSYLTIKLGSVTYNGVIFEQQMDGKSIKTVSFSALARNGVNVWGYKFRDDYSIAWQVNNQTVPVSNNLRVVKNTDLYNLKVNVPNVTVSWTSDQPAVISPYGQYYPVGLEENTAVELTARAEAGRYFWQQTYKVMAQSEENSKPTNTTWSNNMLAHYEFDDADLTNKLNADEKAQLLQNSTAKAPTLVEGEKLRNGKVVHTSFGGNGKESYVSMPNPLKGKELTKGATLSFFVKRGDANLWDALFGMTDGTARFYMTGNLYMGYNSGTGDYIDINHPTTVSFGDLTVGHWHQVTVTIDRNVTTSAGGITIYIDGTKHTNDQYKGQLSGSTFATRNGFDYTLILNLLKTCGQLYLGNGSFWGSPDASFDDVIVYDRVLSQIEVTALHQMVNRSNVNGKTGIDETFAAQPATTDNAVYDLSGRRVTELRPGLYIKNGKKFIVK